MTVNDDNKIKDGAVSLNTDLFKDWFYYGQVAKAGGLEPQ